MSEHRLIYADELYDTLANKLTWLMNYGDEVYLEVGKDIREVIDDQPTADVVEVVRCKNCKYQGNDDECPLLSLAAYTEPDDFCSYGKKVE